MKIRGMAAPNVSLTKKIPAQDEGSPLDPDLGTWVVKLISSISPGSRVQTKSADKEVAASCELVSRTCDSMESVSAPGSSLETHALPTAFVEPCAKPSVQKSARKA